MFQNSMKLIDIIIMRLGERTKKLCLLTCNLSLMDGKTIMP